MSELTLHRLLTRVLYASLAATGAAASAGCGGTDITGYDPPMCTPSETLSVEGLQPGSPINYVEMRRTGPGGGGATVVATAGVKCFGATDRTGCNSRLATTTSSTGFHGSCEPGLCFNYLVTTSGDTVAAVASVAELTAFLSTVDTPQEALLLAYANGYSVSCTERESGGVMLDPSGDGYRVLATRMTKDCAPIEITGFQLQVTKSGTINVVSSSVISTQQGVCVGRRPAGLAMDEGCDGADGARTAVGEYLARTAELEAAAVVAFEILGREIVAHGAPVELARDTAVAAADEVRHARITARLARRYGATPRPPRVAPHGVRGLFDVALENAVEGCVRETYGALVAMWQARMAQDPAVAQAMRGIAVDEVRHAALSWSVARWANGVLPERPKKRIRDAQQQAVSALRSEVAHAPTDGMSGLLGLPTPEQAQILIDTLEASLWQAGG